MAKEVENGRFREDLYYRLNVFPLHMPPLRARPGDIVPLARHFLSRLGGRLGRAGLALSAAAEAELTRYFWPGNIREMENVMQRAVIMAPGEVVDVEHLYLPLPRAPQVREDAVAVVPAAAAADMKSVERSHIMETLAAVNGSRKLAAQRLGMSERTLRYKLQQYREENGALRDE